MMTITISGSPAALERVARALRQHGQARSRRGCFVAAVAHLRRAEREGASRTSPVQAVGA